MATVVFKLYSGEDIMADNVIGLGEIVGDRYCVEKEIGRGWRGTVYLASDLQNNSTKVALKVLRREGKTTAASLCRDLSLLSRLRHPNLTRILDFGAIENGGAVFIIQEVTACKDVVQAAVAWKVPRILETAAQICMALQHLHAHGFFHGNLKPSNILFSIEHGGAEVIKTSDFGVPWQCRGAMQSPMIGEFAYSAPEVLLGEPATPRSDLYSLGVLLYLLLAKRLPFEDDNQGYMVQKHLHGRIDMRPIEALEFGAGLIQLLLSLLEKDGQKRPSTAEDVIRLLSVAGGYDYTSRTTIPAESYFYTGGFVGRESEMAFLHQRLGRVRESGRGHTVFLVGEAGIGKSRCMAEFRIGAIADGWRVVEACCLPSEDRSYSPYRQILDWADRTNRPKPGPLSGSAVFQFGNPMKAGSIPVFEFSSESAAGQFRDRLTRELVLRLSGKPTLLLLHDFHWADEATTAVLDYLSSDISVHPIMICVSLRPGDAENGPLQRLIEQSVRQERAEILFLEALAPISVEALIVGLTGDAQLGSEVGPWIQRASGGNPFFVEEILKHLVDRGVLQRLTPGWHLEHEEFGALEAPPSIALILQQRMECLSPKAIELANWISVFGRPMALEFVKIAAIQDAGSFQAALEELIGKQMIRLVSMRGTEYLEFRHAIMSEVFYKSLPKRQRRTMHRTIGDLLEQSPDAENHIQEIALHFMEGRAHEKGVMYALKAASACRAEFANKAALQFYEYILKNKSTLSQETLCEILVEAAEAYCTLGTPTRAVKLLKRQLGSLGKYQKPSLRAQLLLELSRSYQFQGRLGLSEKMALHCLEYLRNFPPDSDFSSLQSALLAQSAFCKLGKGDPQSALKLAHEALNRSSFALPQPQLGHLHILIGGICCVACQFSEGRKASKNAINILLSINTSSLLAIAFSHLGLNLAGLGKFKEAYLEHQHAVEMARKTRSLFCQAQTICNLAECCTRTGRFKQARQLVEELLRLATFIDNNSIKCAGLLCLVEINILTANYGEALRILKSLTSNRHSSLPAYAISQSFYLRAWMNCEVGNWDGAKTYLEKLKSFYGNSCTFYESGLTQVLWARYFAAIGEKQTAMQILHRVGPEASKSKLAYQMCIIKIWASKILLSDGNLVSARKLTRQVIKLAEAMPSKHLEIEARLLLIQIELSSLDLSNNVIGNHTAILKNLEMELNATLLEAEEIGTAEIAWRIKLELAKVCEAGGGLGESYHHAQAALDGMERIESGLPSALLHGFGEDLQRQKEKRICHDIIMRLRSKSFMPSLCNSQMESAHLSFLFLASSKLNAIRSLDPLLDSILDLYVQEIRCDKAAIFLVNKDSEGLVCARIRNVSRTIDCYDTVPAMIADTVYRSKEPFITTNAVIDPRLASYSKDAVDIFGTLMCAPLETGSRVMGVLYTDHHLPLMALNESAINLFAAFCNMTAIAIDNAMAHAELVEEKEQLETHLRLANEGYTEIIGSSAAIVLLREQIAKAAASPLNAIVWGESGTGKELVARALHRTGRRASGRFIPLDCGALLDNLVESELFGFRKGSFTGAFENREGLLEAANGGVIFLDEISNLSLPLQSKLLRVLQEKEVRRIGESNQRKIDVQVIAATNLDLKEEVRKGRFRKDLYYRLSTMEIRVPSLRERIEDVPVLIEWFLAKTAEIEGGRTKSFCKRAVEILCRYHYPGNVRELCNIVQRAYYFAPGRLIGEEYLPPEILCPCDRSALISDCCPEHPGGFDQGKALYEQIGEGNGTFYDLVRSPFVERHLGSGVVRRVVQCALNETQGRYRDAFRILRIPDSDYSMMMIFLKRHGCYLDFRPFRSKKE